MKALLVFGTLLISLSTTAQQRQAAYWLFGMTFAIDFNEPTLRVQRFPFSVPFGNSEGGWATVCDKNGNFLFGVNNNKVVDRNMKIMKGGSKLHNSQPLQLLNTMSNNFWLPMIVERNQGKYWVFHHTLNTCGPNSVNDYACPGTPNGSITRSIVDMSRESGFGEVINQRQLVDTFSARQMGVAMHSNERDSWLITHGAMDNQFRLYAIRDTGMSFVPVISNVGPRYDKDTVQNYSRYSFSGSLMTSPNSEIIALRTTFVACSDSNVYLFKLNKTTGDVNYMFRIKVRACTYGITFSSDSKKLYCFAGQPLFSPVSRPVDSTFQYDLSILDSSSVANSRINIGFNNIYQATVSMLDLHGRIIYGSTEFNGFLNGTLGIIRNPNNRGPSADQDPSFYVPSTIAKFGSGLPILNQTQLRNAYKLQAIASKDTCCPGDTINVYGYGNQTTRFLWDQNPYLLARNDGTVKAVPLQTTSFQVKGWNLSDSAMASANVVVVPKPTTPSIRWNGSDSLFVNSPVAGTKYYWYKNDVLIRSTNLPQIKADSGFVYKVRSVGAGCLSDASNLVVTTLSKRVPIEALVKIGPNPVVDELVVRTVDDTELQLELFNALGQSVYRGQVNGQQVIKMTAYPRGQYHLQVTTTTGRFAQIGLVKE